MGKVPIRTIIQQKLLEIMAWTAAKSQDDLPVDASSNDRNDSDPVSRVSGYLSSRALKPPE